MSDNIINSLNAEAVEDTFINAMLSYREMLHNLSKMEDIEEPTPKQEIRFEKLKKEVLGLAGFFRTFETAIFGENSPGECARMAERDEFGFTFDNLLPADERRGVV